MFNIFILLLLIFFKCFSCSSLALTRGCSVLLMGPNGSGKVTTVRAASRRLHLHLIKVICDCSTSFFLSFVFFNCYELKTFISCLS